MLAHTNRFLALASVVRNLHSKYQKEEDKIRIHGQIKNLKYRLRLIKNMQALGVLSFIVCIFCMYFIYLDNLLGANITFGIAVLAFTGSLLLSLIEIQLSTKALELELSDMEDLEDPSIMQYIKKKFEKE